MIEINGSTGKNTGGLAEDLLPISECGDGVKCFISICLSILSCPFRIVLIDEPEEYLHPPTAYSLGKNLSQWVHEKHRSLIVSTHSSEFLMGCLQSVPISDISIVRLTYQNNISTVKQLEDSDISLYAKDPLLRSSDVLNALFNDSAVVTEGGDDKIVYQEANNRLVKCERGINNTIFLNANGKYVVHRIIRALRKIGVPAAAIYDFDVLRNEKIKGEEKTLWRAILSSSNIDSSNFDRLENERQYIESKLKELNRKNGQNEDKGYFKKLVSDEIPNELDKKIGKLLNELNEYGIFIVPIGEIEQWLKNINDTHDDDFINILNKIDITTPTNGDIWKFIDDISIWISNSNRKGMFC
jgi:predicted ATP-dependent endonuclease of OLD family